MLSPCLIAVVVALLATAIQGSGKEIFNLSLPITNHVMIFSFMNSIFTILPFLIFAVISNRCADEAPTAVCNSWKEKGGCVWMMAKEKCAATCEYCKHLNIFLSI